MKRNLKEVQEELENRVRLAIAERIKNTSNGTRSIRSFCKEESFSLTTVSEYLNGKRDINSDTLFRLITTLEIEVELKT